MDKYICVYCGYIYGKEHGVYEQGIEAGTKWEDISDDFKCPICNCKKNAMFEKI